MRDYILKVFNTVKGFWDTLTKNQRIIILSIVGAIFFSIVFLAVINLQTPPKDVLFTDLNSEDAGLVTNKLDEMSIEYDISADGKKIFVEEALVHSARMKLAVEGIPKNKGIGFEIFDQSKLGTTDFIQRINFKRAIEGELTRTIESLEEIYSARLHLVIPQPSLYSEEENEPTASVTIELQYGATLEKSNILAIQHLISRSVEALKPDNIVIIDNFGKQLSRIPEENTPENRSKLQLLIKREKENEYEMKIRRFLSKLVPNPEQVQAMVSIDIDFDNIKKTIEQYNPEETVIRSEQLRNKESSVTGDKENSSIRNYEISRTVSEIEEATNSIKRITASVYIDGLYKKVVNQETNEIKLEFIERSEMFMNKVRELVKTAIGYTLIRSDEITVVCLPLDKSRKEAELMDIAEKETQKFWEDKSNLIIVFILFLIIAGIIIRVISVYLPKSISIEEALKEELERAEEEALKEDEEEEIEEKIEPVTDKDQAAFEDEFEGSLLERDLTKDERIKLRTIEELKSLAIDNPELFANLIKGWVTDE